jgi:hypothetical protein
LSLSKTLHPANIIKEPGFSFLLLRSPLSLSSLSVARFPVFPSHRAPFVLQSPSLFASTWGTRRNPNGGTTSLTRRPTSWSTCDAFARVTPF